MECCLCHHEYRLSDLVFVNPVMCPFCILGHGCVYVISKEFKTDQIIKYAVQLIRSPRMIHHLKCIVPSK